MGAIILGLLGVGLLYVGVKKATGMRPSEDSVDLQGTITDVRTERTGPTTSRSKVYYPTIKYWSPATRTDELHTPTAGSGEKFEVGQEVALTFDRETETISIRSARRRAEEYGIALVGVVMIVFAVLELVN